MRVYRPMERIIANYEATFSSSYTDWSQRKKLVHFLWPPTCAWLSRIRSLHDVQSLSQVTLNNAYFRTSVAVFVSCVCVTIQQLLYIQVFRSRWLI